MQWDEGKNNFAIDPPNATVSVLGGDGSDVSDAVVTLKSPKLVGNTLTFDISVLEGSLSGAAGPAALQARCRRWRSSIRPEPKSKTASSF
ncbi:hypothetical protein ASC97_25510 [Rhizobium sp. Root1203]|nr:hypothetical protein ASC97_25510 [Rhizobium sp. Root1203]